MFQILTGYLVYYGFFLYIMDNILPLHCFPSINPTPTVNKSKVLLIRSAMKYFLATINYNKYGLTVFLIHQELSSLKPNVNYQSSIS